MSIFLTGEGESNRGRVLAFEEPGNLRGNTLTLDDWGGFTALKSIITSVSFGEGTLHQYSHMLGERIYLNVFGDQMGSLMVSGLSFEDKCEDSRIDTPGAGITKVLAYYRRNRLSVRPDPVRLTLMPDTVLRGYLEKMRGAVVDPATQAYQFTLMFGLIPDEAPFD